MRTTSIFAAGDRAAAEWTFSGKYTGQFPGFPPGTGQPMEFQGAAILELHNGQIVHDTEYVNYLAILRGMGLLPGAPATPGVAMATPSS